MKNKTMTLEEFADLINAADLLESVDDYHENLINADYFGILYNTPHNRDFKEDGKSIVRVFNWEGVYNLISKQYEIRCQKEQYIKKFINAEEEKKIKNDRT